MVVLPEVVGSIGLCCLVASKKNGLTDFNDVNGMLLGVQLENIKILLGKRELLNSNDSIEHTSGLLLGYPWVELEHVSTARCRGTLLTDVYVVAPT